MSRIEDFQREKNRKNRENCYWTELLLLRSSGREEIFCIQHDRVRGNLRQKGSEKIIVVAERIRGSVRVSESRCGSLAGLVASPHQLLNKFYAAPHYAVIQDCDWQK